MRSSGILIPVFSLPSEGGIGCFSKEAYDLIDWLSLAGQKYWQILPLGPAGSWNSPYQPLSCFAGDSLYINPISLKEQGLLTDEDIRPVLAAFHLEDDTKVNYELVRVTRKNLLRKAFSRFNPSSEYNTFCKDNEHWLENYALFIALHDHFDSVSWSEWPEPVRSRKEKTLSFYRELLEEDIRYHIWTQFEFYREWAKIVDYAHQKGVEIIGDIPIYVSMDSADCWANPELFKLGRGLQPTAVSGCPPDAFSETGQRWGNPLYNWKRMKQSGYDWWIQRLRQSFQLYDVIRIDHVRGLESYYSIPANAKTALEGKWIKGPGMAFFRAIREALPNSRFIAEDLGHITPEVRRMIDRAGLPGMKVLQFAFDSDGNNPYYPENFGTNSVVYTGTHDNNTTTGWYGELSEEKKRLVTSYLRLHQGIPDNPKSQIAPIFGAKQVDRHMVELAFRCKANLCIIPLQDYLAMGTEGRINTPGTVGGNWEWRYQKAALSEELAAYVRHLVQETNR